MGVRCLNVARLGYTQLRFVICDFSHKTELDRVNIIKCLGVACDIASVVQKKKTSLFPCDMT